MVFFFYSSSRTVILLVEESFVSFVLFLFLFLFFGPILRPHRVLILKKLNLYKKRLGNFQGNLCLFKLQKNSCPLVCKDIKPHIILWKYAKKNTCSDSSHDPTNFYETIFLWSLGHLKEETLNFWICEKDKNIWGKAISFFKR